jgi:hypothetical protein
MFTAHIVGCQVRVPVCVKRSPAKYGVRVYETSAKRGRYEFTRLNTNHIDTAYNRINLGYIYRKLGRRKEAEDYYLQGVNVYEQVLGLSSHRTGRVLGEVCWQLLRMGRLRQAAPMGVRGLKSLGLKESIRSVALTAVILPAKRFIGRILWKS